MLLVVVTSEAFETARWGTSFRTPFAFCYSHGRWAGCFVTASNSDIYPRTVNSIETCLSEVDSTFGKAIALFIARSGGGVALLFLMAFCFPMPIGVQAVYICHSIC